MSILVTAMLDMRDLFEAMLESGADPAVTLDGIHAAGAYILNAYRTGVFDSYYIDRMADFSGVAESMANRDSPLEIAYFGAVIGLELDQVAGQMLEAGHDPDAIQFPEVGWGPLHLAASVGNSLLVELLIESGGDVELRDNDGATPLHVLDGDSATEIGRLLIDSGADLDAKDFSGATPLPGFGATAQMAPAQLSQSLANAIARGATIGEMRDLLEEGAGSTEAALREPDEYGRTTFHLATNNGAEPAILLLLLKHGADAFVPDDFGETPFLAVLNRLDLSEVLGELVIDRRSAEYRDGSGRTALHLVAARQFELIDLMIEFGHDVNSYDDEGMTPLSLAASSGYADADLSVEVLIGSGAYVDSVDIYGWTSLMHAARSGNWLTFELLLDYGADPYAQDGNGQSVLCHAGAGGDLAIVDALIEIGVDIDLGGPLVQAAFYVRLGARPSFSIMSAPTPYLKHLFSVEPETGTSFSDHFTRSTRPRLTTIGN